MKTTLGFGQMASRKQRLSALISDIHNVNGFDPSPFLENHSMRLFHATPREFRPSLAGWLPAWILKTLHCWLLMYVSQSSPWLKYMFQLKTDWVLVLDRLDGRSRK
jgi:hypothetical protein